jgi:uncharacterized membrane protein YbhN (UPF0104 family)
MENKQTALEWFTNEITLFGSIKIDPSGKEFIQFNYSLYRKVLLEAKQMEKEQTTEKTNMTNTNNNIQTKTTWSENKRWTVAVIGLLCVIGFMSALVIYNLFWYVIVSVLCVWLLGVMLVASKDIVDDLIDEW